MRIAVWDIRPCRLLLDSIPSDKFEILYTEPDECRALLDSGSVDAALLPIEDVLSSVDEYAVLPDAVLASAASFPYASLTFSKDLRNVEDVEAHTSARPAIDVAEIILREEFGLDVRIHVRAARSTNGSIPDSTVEFGHPSVINRSQGEDAGRLDIGQEWFELTGYPLVWGVFAVRAGSAVGDLSDVLATAARFAVKNETVSNWLAAQTGVSEEEATFIEQDVRFEFDDEVVAGLDELAHYLFYFGKVDDIPIPRFVGTSKSNSQSH